MVYGAITSNLRKISSSGSFSHLNILILIDRLNQKEKS
jgi:hypothetical protein